MLLGERLAWDALEQRGPGPKAGAWVTGKGAAVTCPLSAGLLRPASSVSLNAIPLGPWPTSVYLLKAVWE